MSELYVFNKPFRVLSQFTSDSDKQCLAQYISTPNIYCAGRLDYDSEGLLLLTDDGALQHQLSHPKFGTEKHYWAQVEGELQEQDINALLKGVLLKDGAAKATHAKLIDAPAIWERKPPIRYRAKIMTSWLSLSITEGRNRQVRRMTANIGFPTLRLIRHKIGNIELGELPPGELRKEQL
ncbi:MAG: pseudouridine synthase [Pseudomonadales bacterium]